MGQNSAKPITIYNDSENFIGDTYEEAEAVDELHLLQKELDSLDTSFEIMKQELVCPLCKNLLQKPCQISCGHIFCYECIIKMGKFTRKCPLCKTLFHNENIFHSAIVENLVYAYRRCIKSFQEIENHRSIFIKKLESVRSSSNNNNNNESNPFSNNNNNRYRLDDEKHHNSLPTSTSNNNNNNNKSISRSLSSQYRLPQLNEFFLPDEPPKTPHELPPLSSPPTSLLNSQNNSQNNTPSLSPNGDTVIPSFLDSINDSNLKSSHNHLLKPLDKTNNLTPPHSTCNYKHNCNKCRSRGYSDTTNASFFIPPAVNFHSSEKCNRLLDTPPGSFSLTPVEVVSTPTTENSDNSTPPTNATKAVDVKKKKSNLNPYSTPPATPEKKKETNETFTSSPEYTCRRLADDDKEDNYIVMSASPAVNRDKRAIRLDSNIINESNEMHSGRNSNHLIVGSPLCSPNRKKAEMKSISSIVLDKDDENAKVVTSVDSLLDGIPNSSDSMICHNGDI